MSLKVLDGYECFDFFSFLISYPALRILIQGKKITHQIPRESVLTQFYSNACFTKNCHMS